MKGRRSLIEQKDGTPVSQCPECLTVEIQFPGEKRPRSQRSICDLPSVPKKVCHRHQPANSPIV